MQLPSYLKTDARKRSELFAYLVANSYQATSMQPGDRVFVLTGYHDKHPDIVDEQTTEFIAATAMCADVVEFDRSRNTWHLHGRGLVVKVEHLDKFLMGTPISSIDIDTSHLDKLVLEADSKKEILSVLKQHNHMNKIFKEWGLDEIMEYGKAMSFLFYGPPGTGKTWAATCIAKALKKELIVISAAEIQTSEPGGANRNIEEAFKQAKVKNCVLFLDECDGLITDRSHVGMILASEINTLLTCLEKFEDVVVFATNRADTLDPAMARRISLMIEFKNPDEATRLDIWNVMLPKKLPLAKDVKIEKLAKFELTGGYIKNVILSAARTAAAEEATEVNMKHFAQAIKRVKDTKDIMGTHITPTGLC